MEEKKVTLSNGKEFIIKEVLYKDVVSKQLSEDRTEVTKTLLQLSAGITDEEWNILSMKDGVVLQKAVNEINGLTEDFLQETPLKKDISAI